MPSGPKTARMRFVVRGGHHLEITIGHCHGLSRLRDISTFLQAFCNHKKPSTPSTDPDVETTRFYCKTRGKGLEVKFSDILEESNLRVLCLLMDLSGTLLFLPSGMDRKAEEEKDPHSSHSPSYVKKM